MKTNHDDPDDGAIALDLPEAPKSVGKPSLKQGTAAAPPVAPPNAGPAAQQSKSQSALSNLDDVLQRRRA